MMTKKFDGEDKEIAFNLHVSGSFLKELDRKIDELRLLGLDVTILKFTHEDAFLFKKDLRELSGIDVSSVGMYKGIMTRRTKRHRSHIVAMDCLRENYSRRFDMVTGMEFK